MVQNIRFIDVLYIGVLNMSHNIYKLFKMELHDKIIFILGLILSLFSSGLTLLIPKFIGSSITKSFIKSIYNHIEFLFMALLLFVGTYFGSGAKLTK